MGESQGIKPEDDDAAVFSALGLHPLENTLAVVEDAGLGRHWDGTKGHDFMLAPLPILVGFANGHEVGVDRSPGFLRHFLPVHRGGGVVFLGLVRDGIEAGDARRRRPLREGGGGGGRRAEADRARPGRRERQRRRKGGRLRRAQGAKDGSCENLRIHPRSPDKQTLNTGLFVRSTRMNEGDFFALVHQDGHHPCVGFGT